MKKRNILNSTYTICSTGNFLQEEIKFIKSTFEKIKNYPKYIISQLKHEFKLKHTHLKNDVVSSVNGSETDKRHLLVSPYTGIKGEKLVKSMNNFSSKVLPSIVKIK